MRKYLNLQMAIFIIISVLGVSISSYYMHKELDYIDLLSQAMESLRARTELKTEIEALTRVSTLDRKEEALSLISRMEDSLKVCTGCHGKGHHSSVAEIKNVILDLKDRSFGSAQYYKTLERLVSLYEEASQRGDMLINKRIARAEALSLTLWEIFSAILLGLLFVLVLFSLYINRRAKRHMEGILEAVTALTEEEDLPDGLFQDEFRKIGDAFKNLQQELRIKEEKLRNWADNWQLTFDTVEEMIALSDLEGRILMYNRAFRDRFGDSLEGQDIDELIGRHFPDKRKSLIRECIRTEKTHKEEIGNSEQTIEISIYPLKNREGKIVGGIWIGHDITVQKELEQRALHSEKMVALGELVAGIAHEINNPLSVVVGYSEMLYSDSALPRQYQRRLEKVYQSALRASNIIKVLLEFSRKKPARLIPCDINEQINRTLGIMEYEIRADGIELKKELSSERLILADPIQIGQIFVNLIKNAHDAVIENGSTKEIHIKTFHDRDFVYAQVADTGGGISKEHMHRIFEPFYTTKDVGVGTGLGLSITYSIVKAHGGDIEVENNNSGGATFKLRFPQYREEVREDIDES